MNSPRDRIEAGLGLTGPPLRRLREAPPAIPDHRLIRCIGHGGYGEVWLARNALGSLRAVKVVDRDNFKDERPYEREFAGIRRFEPLSRLNEGFVDVLQVGRNDAEGWFYYVMELADDAGAAVSEGAPGAADSPRSSSDAEFGAYVPRTLSGDLRRLGRLPFERCLELGLNLTLALGYLHRQGLIHRDIKPSNIIFVGGVPKLADIGLVTDAAGANTFVGTEGYIPPEGPNSPQADLFALGKVLYEVAMGKERHEFPEPYSALGVDRDSLALMELNAVLLRACASDPRERYGSAEEMHADLALLHSGGSVKRRHQSDRQLRRAKRAVLAVASLALLVATGWVWQRGQTHVVRQLAEEKTRLAGEKATAARQSLDRLIQMQTASGLRALEANEPGVAALWFAEALRLSEGDLHAQTRQRFRLGALFRQLASPVARMRLQHGARGAGLTANGESAVAVGFSPGRDGGTAEMKVWDLASQRLVQSLVLSNATEVPSVSANARWAVVSQPKQTRIWDVGSGHPLEGPWELHRAAFSPNEQRIAGAEPDGTNVFIRDLPSARLAVPPLPHGSPVTLVAFDPTGRWLVTACADPDGGQFGLVRVWDAATGRPHGDWIEVSGGAHQAAFSPDGRAVAIYPSWPRSVNDYQPITATVVLDLPSGKLRFPRLVLRGAVRSVVFSPDGRHLAIGPKAFPIQVFDARTGEVVHRALPHDNVHDLVLRCSPDGAWLAAAGETGVLVWDLRSGARIGAPLHFVQPVVGLDFLPAGNRLLCADESGLISLYDLANSEMSVPVLAPPDRWLVTCGLFAPEGRRLATVSAEGDVNVWPLEGESRLPIELRAKAEIVTKARHLDTKMAWSPDGALLAVAKNDFTVRIWDVAAGREHVAPLKHAGFVADLGFNRDGTRLATASLDGSARLWEVGTGRATVTPLQHGSPVIGIRFDPDGRRVLSATQNGELRWWNASTGERLGSVQNLGGRIADVALSSDGAWVAVAGDGGEVILLNGRTGGTLGVLARHAGKVYRVMFSPDGRRLLTASHDKTARIWEVPSGTPLTPPLLHRDAVTTAAFSPDGLRIIAGSADGIARVWDAASGEPLSAPIRQEGAILFTGFSPDGNRVFVSSLHGSSEVREVPGLDWGTDEIVAAAELASGTAMDSAERTRPLTLARAEAAWSKVAAKPRSPASVGVGSAASWHQQQMLLNERVHDWFAAEFHGRRLVQLLPGEAAPRAALARLAELRPPTRDPAAPPGLIDLSTHYNAPLSVNWLQGEPENNLAELPRGIARLAGTQFDVRGLIQLRGQPPAGGAFNYPSQVNGIRVGREVRRLHFLHSTTGDTGVRKGARLGSYVVHYAGGRTEEIPIRYRVDLGDWWEGPDGVPPESPVAWRGMNPIARHHGMKGVRLFKLTWTNPAPDLEVSHVDFVSEGNYGRPFLVALTAE